VYLDWRCEEVAELIWCAADDPAEVEGAPVALQMITMKLEEEKALALVGLTAKALAVRS
jgi:hypothetical protein